MSDPVFKDCTADTWVLVAEDVTSGFLWRAKLGPIYLHTYRDTGGDAPTEQSEGMPIFRDSEPDFEEIKAKAGIDLYIFCIGNVGRVRVDV